MQVACKRRPHALVYDRYWRKADSVIAMEMEAHEAREDGGCLGEESCGDPMPLISKLGSARALRALRREPQPVSGQATSPLHAADLT